jgi:hypothetical protein
MRFAKMAIVGLAAGGLLTVPTVAASAAPSGGCPSPANAPVLTLSASPATVIAAHNATASGKFTENSCAITGATIKLQRRALVSGKPSGAWTTFATVTTGPKGGFSAGHAPTVNERQRAVFAASGRFPATVSKAVTVTVKTAVTVSITTLSNCRIMLTGRTTPAKANRTFAIQSRGPKGAFTGWSTIGHFHTTSTGTYKTIGAAACGTTYNLAVTIAGDATNATGRSRTVYAVKPHH